jgi:hypothetical protein
MDIPRSRSRKAGAEPVEPARLLPPALLARFVAESRCVHLFVLGHEGTILAVNAAVEAASGAAAAALEGRPVTRFLAASSRAPLLARISAAILDDRAEPLLLSFVDAAGQGYTLSCRLHAWGGSIYLLGEPVMDRERAVRDALLHLHAETARVVRERTRSAAELAAELHDLERSHWHIRKQREHLLVCAACHRVSEPESRWEQLTTFLRRNGLPMTHGYCPGCEDEAFARLDALYPEATAAG